MVGPLIQCSDWHQAGWPSGAAGHAPSTLHPPGHGGTRPTAAIGRSVGSTSS